MNELVKLGPWFAVYGLDTPDKIADVLDEAWSLRDRQVKKITRLEAIVAKLPKCWQQVDGKPLWKLVQDCPVVLGMELWVPGTGVWDDKLWKIKVTAIDSEGFLSTNIGGRPQHWDSRLCANSPEAAEALAAKQGKESE